MSDTSVPEIARPPGKKPFQFSLRAMLIGVAAFALLLGILVPLMRVARREAQRLQCSNNLRQIVLALHYYHGRYKSFPPAYIPGPDGKPMHSWRALLRPYLDSQMPLPQYRYDEPWDGPNNRTLHQTECPVFRCPAEDPNAAPTMTSYLAVVGPGTAWPGPEPTKFSNITDGTSYSIMIVEVVDSGIHWLEPRDLTLDDLPLAINPKSGKGISSNHVRGAWVALADGSTHFLPNDVAADMLRRMIIINDGERFSWNETSADQ